MKNLNIEKFEISNTQTDWGAVWNEIKNDEIVDQARTQFFLEDKLERDFASGFISEEEYNEGLQGIFRNFQTMYGF
jgi:hypothetical protein